MKKIKLALMSLVAIFAANFFADVVNLNQLTGNKVVHNNSTIIGELRRIDGGRVNDRKISIASGATIYLSDAKTRSKNFQK